MLEAPRLEAMRQVAEQARVAASIAEEARAAENARRAEVRARFTAATSARTAVASATGAVMAGVGRARAAATSELCAAGGGATEQVRFEGSVIVQHVNGLPEIVSHRGLPLVFFWIFFLDMGQRSRPQVLWRTDFWNCHCFCACERSTTDEATTANNFISIQAGQRLSWAVERLDTIMRDAEEELLKDEANA